jgi:CheY-like chemotaxis protein
MPAVSIRVTSESSIAELEWAVANIEPAIVGKRCLVLDDEFLIALDIQQILEAAGAASAVCVADADAALAALNSGVQFDLAVLDLKLSGSTRTSETVAAALTNRGTPFVFLTGMREDEQLTQFPNVPVVEKPYEAPRVLDAVLRALGAR